VCAASHPGELARGRRPLSEPGAAVAQVRRKGGRQGPGRRPFAQDARFDECAAERGIGLRPASSRSCRPIARRRDATRCGRSDRQGSADGSRQRERSGQQHCEPDALRQRIPDNALGQPAVISLDRRQRRLDDEFSTRSFDRPSHLERHRVRRQVMIEPPIEITQGDGAKERHGKKACHRGDRVVDPGRHPRSMRGHGVDDRRGERRYRHRHAEAEDRDRQQECRPIRPPAGRQCQQRQAESRDRRPNDQR